MKFREIWFDLDGTLAVPDTNWHLEHDALKYKIYSEFIKEPVTKSLKENYDKLYEQYRSNSAVFRSLGLPAGYWIDHYEAADMSSFYPTREDVPRILRELNNRAILGLFTNNKASVVSKTLDRLNIPPDLFRKTVTGDTIKERKPNLHGFRAMLEKAGCQPNELIYIGDRYHVDIEPAQQLGMAGGLVWSHDDRADFNFPEFIDLLKLNS